jgi:hypothetical protein
MVRTGSPAARSSPILGFVAVALGACAAQDSGARSFAAALDAAARRDPSAWSRCAGLGGEEDRGSCEVLASKTRSDRAAACDEISSDAARGECWFVYAEDLVAVSRWDDAIHACTEAGPYRMDCGRHLWLFTGAGGDPGRGVRERILAAIPGSGAAGGQPVPR